MIIPSNGDQDRKFQQVKNEAAVHHKKVSAERVKANEDRMKLEAVRLARFDSRLKR